MTQLALPFTRTWQTLGEFAASLDGTPRPDQHGSFAYTRMRAIDLQRADDAAYVRVRYKWQVVQAIERGESVPAWVWAEHPVLWAIYGEVVTNAKAN